MTWNEYSLYNYLDILDPLVFNLNDNSFAQSQAQHFQQEEEKLHLNDTSSQSSTLVDRSSLDNLVLKNLDPGNNILIYKNSQSPISSASTNSATNNNTENNNHSNINDNNNNNNNSDNADTHTIHHINVNANNISVNLNDSIDDDFLQLNNYDTFIDHNNHNNNNNNSSGINSLDPLILHGFSENYPFANSLNTLIDIEANGINNKALLSNEAVQTINMNDLTKSNIFSNADKILLANEPRQTISMNELTEPNSSNPISNKPVKSPILKSQMDENSLGCNYNYNYIGSIPNSESNSVLEIPIVMNSSDSITNSSASTPTNLEINSSLSISNNNNKSKKISDSRLSLAQLSIVLNLKGNIKETAKREKEILNILKTDLEFPLGEKTWIRDTPVEERERLIDELSKKVETQYNYGYTKKTLSIVVRRASYYLMQGRLRRERRMERKRKD